jgi:hypothetical protein
MFSEYERFWFERDNGYRYSFTEFPVDEPSDRSGPTVLGRTGAFVGSRLNGVFVGAPSAVRRHSRPGY